MSHTCHGLSKSPWLDFTKLCYMGLQDRIKFTVCSWYHVLYLYLCILLDQAAPARRNAYRIFICMNILAN